MSSNLGYLPDRAASRLSPPPAELKRWRGLGDLLHALFRMLGIVSFVERRSAQTGKPCGCAARREALNRAVPFDNAPTNG